jgi:hypothetical protein
MAEVRDLAAVQILVDTLSGTDPFATAERMHAASALAEWLQGDGVDLELRIGVIGTLPNRLARFELGKVLVPVIDSVSPRALRAAALHAFATARNVNVLGRLPSRPDPEFRRLVVESLDEIARRPRSTTRWNEHMARLHSDDREQAALAVSNLALTFGRDREAIAILNERLRDEDPTIRWAAASGLGLLSELGPLIELCATGGEPSSDVRRTMAMGIGLRPVEAPGEADALRRLLADADPKVANEARKALRALGLLPRPARKAPPTAKIRSKGRWPTLVSRLNERWLNDDDFLLELPDDVIKQGWLGHPPASPAQIDTAEVRLGVRLPPSYREFLAASNGWQQVAQEAGKLLPVESIDWFADDHQEWIDAYADAEEHTGLRRAILLSDGTEAVILLATEIPGAPDECQAWYFANWIPGAMTFPSFKHLMTWATKPD